MTTFECPVCELADDDVTQWPVVCACGNRYETPEDAVFNRQLYRTTGELMTLVNRFCRTCKHWSRRGCKLEIGCMTPHRFWFWKAKQKTYLCRIGNWESNQCAE